MNYQECNVKKLLGIGNIMKNIFIMGGVVSSLGKGIIGASIGALLKSKGYKIFIQKLDPYLNVDSGTMNPNQHGEVFVTEDGMETDLDLGHYERFTEEFLTKNSSITQGKIYIELLKKERSGEYLGETVQVIPHVTNLIKEKILQSTDKNITDIMITEVGGTIGDIESLPFIESIRSLKSNLSNDVLIIYVTLVPYLKTSGEFKTKPTQHSVSQLRSLGLTPDILILRSIDPVPNEVNKKISLFCGINQESIFNLSNVNHIYKVPLLMNKQNITQVIENKLSITKNSSINIKKWEKLIYRINYIDKIEDDKVVNIAIICKYIGTNDLYISVEESLKHAAYKLNIRINIIYLSTDDIELNENINLEKDKRMNELHGILVPGGFGKRGTEGKIKFIKYARENNIPFLGICLGMQLASIEFARNVLNLKDATSEEFNPNSKELVVKIINKENTEKGGTQRLGAYKCKLKQNTKVYDLYDKIYIDERHRHRYEFNNKYKDLFNKNGMRISGINEKENLVEIIELIDHKYFIAVQFHPEFKSTMFSPHPLFLGFIEAAGKYKNDKYKK